MVGVHRLEMFEIVLGASIKMQSFNHFREIFRRQASTSFDSIFCCYPTESLALTQQ